MDSLKNIAHNLFSQFVFYILNNYLEFKFILVPSIYLAIFSSLCNLEGCEYLLFNKLFSWYRDSVYIRLYEAFSSVNVAYKVETKQGDARGAVQFNCNISLSSLTDACQLQFVERVLTKLDAQKQHRR